MIKLGFDDKEDITTNKSTGLGYPLLGAVGGSLFLPPISTIGGGYAAYRGIKEPSSNWGSAGRGLAALGGAALAAPVGTLGGLGLGALSKSIKAVPVLAGLGLLSGTLLGGIAGYKGMKAKQQKYNSEVTKEAEEPSVKQRIAWGFLVG